MQPVLTKKKCDKNELNKLGIPAGQGFAGYKVGVFSKRFGRYRTDGAFRYIFVLPNHAFSIYLKDGDLEEFAERIAEESGLNEIAHFQER